MNPFNDSEKVITFPICAVWEEINDFSVAPKLETVLIKKDMSANIFGCAVGDINLAGGIVSHSVINKVYKS